MNAKKGCLRILIVLSLLSAIGGFIRLVTASTDAQAEAGFITMIAGPAVIIIIYLIIYWIVKGFNETA
jgi:hypothetical protein